MLGQGGIQRRQRTLRRQLSRDNASRQQRRNANCRCHEKPNRALGRHRIYKPTKGKIALRQICGRPQIAFGEFNACAPQRGRSGKCRLPVERLMRIAEIVAIVYRSVFARRPLPGAIEHLPIIRAKSAPPGPLPRRKSIPQRLLRGAAVGCEPTSSPAMRTIAATGASSLQPPLLAHRPFATNVHRDAAHPDRVARPSAVSTVRRRVPLPAP